MPKAKPKKESTFQVKVWAGTPHEMKTDTKKTPVSVKTFVRGKMLEREKWAARYNHAMRQQLVKVREAFEALELKETAAGERFEWTVVDDHTGVKFVFGCEVISK